MTHNTSPERQQAYNDLLARTLDSVRIAGEDLAVACEDINEVLKYGHGLRDMIGNSRGTTLIRELRAQLNKADKLLPHAVVGGI